MAKTLYWIQGGSYGGDTWSLFNADTPDLIELFDFMGLKLLWHQALSAISADELQTLNDRILSGQQPLDILCLEGSVIHGPNGSGRFDMLPSGPKMKLIEALAHKAKYVLAVGTCASFGGIGADSSIMATGHFSKASDSSV